MRYSGRCRLLASFAGHVVFGDSGWTFLLQPHRWVRESSTNLKSRRATNTDMDQDDLQSQRVITQPPSCIEFCPADPSIFVVGTYKLEECQANTSSSTDGTEAQSRSGRLEVYQVKKKPFLSGFLVQINTCSYGYCVHFSKMWCLTRLFHSMWGRWSPTAGVSRMKIEMCQHSYQMNQASTV